MEEGELYCCGCDDAWTTKIDNFIFYLGDLFASFSSVDGQFCFCRTCKGAIARRSTCHDHFLRDELEESVADERMPIDGEQAEEDELSESDVEEDSTSDDDLELLESPSQVPASDLDNLLMLLFRSHIEHAGLKSQFVDNLSAMKLPAEFPNTYARAIAAVKRNFFSGGSL